MNEPVGSLLVFAVIVFAITLACGIVAVAGWVLAWFVNRYTMDHISEELDRTDDDLLT